jgi:phospholipid/cholesterol/gamma-HCH transport system substrate-binding protein
VNKQAPTLGRMLVMVGFALSCFGLLLFLWLAFGGAIPLKPKGYRFEVSFAEGTQLAQEADVRISGVPVGKVKTVDADPQSGRSTAVIELEERFAPLPRDSKAILRQKTLLGETYVELTPGDGRRAGFLPEEGQLPPGQVSPTVELDEIFRAFDPQTRRRFQVWMQSQSQALDGRARDISDTLGNLDPFAEDTTKVLEVLNSQEAAVRQVVRNTGVVFDALSERRGQLQSAIRNSDQVFETTAARNADLQELFRVLPTFNREATTTVRRLTTFARETDPLITQLRPAAREFSPTFRELQGLAPDLRALFRDLDPLITASETGLPALRRFLDDLRPALGEFDPTLKQLNPILSWLGEYRDTIRAYFANGSAATQARTPDGVHYLRTSNPQNPENLAVYPRRIGSNRTNPYLRPRGFDDLDRGGLLSFETRHCRQGNPSTADAQQLAGLLQQTLPNLQAPPPTTPPNPLAAPTPDPSTLAGNILTFIFANAGREVPAPACREQPPFTMDAGAITQRGETSKYPRVREARSSTTVPGE